MGYESMTTSSIKVVEPMVFDMHPGGRYNLNEDNYVETAVVKLHLLSHFVDMMINSYCCTGENQIILGTETDALANQLFDLYRPLFEAGIDIAKYNEYYDEKQLYKYLKRPIVNGEFNATAEETHEGFPVGWWYDFPGIAHKQFPFGKVCIDVDTEIRVWVYDAHDECNDNVIDGIEIGCDADYGKLFVKWPGAAAELATIAKIMWADNQEYNNPQI
jgi:hypothetical protein